MHVSGELSQLFFQPHQLFFRIKDIVKPMDGGYGAILVKFGHADTPFVFF